MFPRLTGQPQVEVNIMDGRQLMPENFLDAGQMPHVGARKMAAGIATAVLVDGSEIVGVIRVADSHLAPGGEERAVARVAGRHDAVEHIHAAADAFQDVLRGANAHEIPRFVFGQYRTADRRNPVNVFLRFPHADAADCIPLKIHRRKLFGAFCAQVVKHAALNDRKQRLAVPIERRHGCKRILAPRRPSHGQAVGALGILVCARVRRAFIENHTDIAAEFFLNLNYVFGPEEMLGAVDVRGEHHAVVVEFAQLRETEDLITAAVGEHWPLPTDKPVQPAGFVDDFGAGPQIQMIGVAEDDLRAVLEELAVLDGFDVAQRADRHKYRRFNDAVIGFQQTRAGARSGRTFILMQKCEFHVPATASPSIW